MTDFNKRNWTLDIVCTLLATCIMARGADRIHNAVDSLTRPQVAEAHSTATEDPLEELRHDPTTAGAFVPVAAAASSPPSTADAEEKVLWRSDDALAVDTIRWMADEDRPLLARR